jgi:hypothetical protein
MQKMRVAKLKKLLEQWVKKEKYLNQMQMEIELEGKEKSAKTQ